MSVVTSDQRVSQPWFGSHWFLATWYQLLIYNRSSCSRWSPSETNVSVARNRCSNRHSWEWNQPVFTRPRTTQSWNAMWTSGRTCTPTRYCPEAQPCIRESQTGCRRKSRHSPRPQWKSKQSHRPNASTPCGSVAPSWRPYLLSNKCGFRRPNTTRVARPLFTGNASKVEDYSYRCYSHSLT